MAILFVATSKSLAEWGEEVGLTKHLYQIGLAEEPPEAIAQTLNDGQHAGRADWTLVKHMKAPALTDLEIRARLGKKEKAVDPALYPRIRGALGIFKVKITNVENHILVKKALAGEAPKALKLKPADIAAYLFANVTGEGGDEETPNS